MANKLYEETHIQNIANAIREKTGKEDSMTVEQMATEIDGIETGGGVTYADWLYKFYGIDKNEYPYLAIFYNSSEYVSKTCVVFCKTITTSTTSVIFINGYYVLTSEITPSNFPANLNLLVTTIQANVPLLTRVESNIIGMTTSGSSNRYTNFDVSFDCADLNV